MLHPSYTTLIETGTGYGDLPFRLADEFDRIITIEANPRRSAAARKRLLPFPNIEVVRGNSGARLWDYIEGPSMLWLDAHEDVEGGASVLRTELDVLARSPYQHVILIDDARLCVGENGWPTVGEVEEWALTNCYSFDLMADVMRLQP